ncbi:MAG: envelope stress response membrane protein PspB [Alphaproteobacteria bacterium]|nr:envelope stress response membrane protein PspB [Alphaproteobacteria bacterium]
MDDSWMAIPICALIFVGMPWVILHYITQWRKGSSLSVEDEHLLDDMYETARKLEDRMMTIERIIAADHPNWKPENKGDTL